MNSFKYSVILICVLLMNCGVQQDIDVQGHRGCRGLMPENTLEAFKTAIALGVNTLELDVVVSKDGKVVVSHEPFISRTYCLDILGNNIPKGLDKSYNLYAMPYDSIKQFDCGSKFYPKFPDQQKLKTFKPTLDEVIKLSILNSPDIKFNIEIKSKPEYDNIYTPNPKDFVSLVLKVVNDNAVVNSVNLQSFDLRVLEEIKQQQPEIEIALLVDENEAILDKLSKLSFVPDIVSPYYKLLDAKMVENLQTEFFKVIPWTVNDTKDLKQMLRFGVDGIITDYPNRLIELLK